MVSQSEMSVSVRASGWSGWGAEEEDEQGSTTDGNFGININIHLLCFFKLFLFSSVYSKLFSLSFFF